MPSDGSNLTSASLHILIAIGPEERHGYAIMTEVERITHGAVRLAPGTLYVNIRRLVVAQLIEETEGRPDDPGEDQRRRYYRLTLGGRAVVARELARLETLMSAARPWALQDRT